MTLTFIFKGTLVILAALGLAYIFIITIGVWVGLLIAILVASALRPAILRLIKWRLPQGAAVLIVYLGLAAVTLTLLVIVLPPVINQFVGYVQNDDRLANRIISAQSWVRRTITQITGSEFELGITPEEIRAAISDIVDTIRVTAPSLFGSGIGFLGEFILIVVMGLYWVTAREQAIDFLVELTPVSRRGQIKAIFTEIEVGLGGYVRGIVLISLIMGILCFAILALLGVPGAATLSFLYAVATAIPIIGGLIGVVLATFLALLTSPLNAVIVLVVTFLLQQVENYYLTPRILSSDTDFHPLLVIIFVSIGFSLGGITGSLIAIPLAGTASILLNHLILAPRKATVVHTNVGSILLPSSYREK